MALASHQVEYHLSDTQQRLKKKLDSTVRSSTLSDLLVQGLN
jgi:hypothetical protein